MAATCEKHSEPAQDCWQSNACQAGGCPEGQPLATCCPPAGPTLLPREQEDRKESYGERQCMHPAPCPYGIPHLQACDQPSPTQSLQETHSTGTYICPGHQVTRVAAKRVAVVRPRCDDTSKRS